MGSKINNFGQKEISAWKSVASITHKYTVLRVDARVVSQGVMFSGSLDPIQDDRGTTVIRIRDAAAEMLERPHQIDSSNVLARSIETAKHFVLLQARANVTDG